MRIGLLAVRVSNRKTLFLGVFGLLGASFEGDGVFQGFKGGLRILERETSEGKMGEMSAFFSSLRSPFIQRGLGRTLGVVLGYARRNSDKTDT